MFPVGYVVTGVVSLDYFQRFLNAKFQGNIEPSVVMLFFLVFLGGAVF